jgi:scyllo-inositol 2-dehydrogenase (NADP+)
VANEQIQVGIIGYGGAFNMGRAHGQACEETGMKVVAVCDIDPDREAVAKEDFPACDYYTDYKELLKHPGVGLVINILPHNLHASVCIDAMNAGKNVVVEKPMCMNVAEADAMIEAAERNKVMLSVFHNRRWDGDFNTIKELIDQGMIGDVFHIEAAMGGMHHPGTWWRSYKDISGGAMFDWGAHIVDWILQFVPQNVKGVDGYYHKLRWHDISNEDHTELVIRFESGVTAQVEISYIAAATKPRWRILGTKGAIVMPGWDRIEVTVDHEGHLAKFDAPMKQSDWKAYYRNIWDHLANGANLVVKASESRRNIAIIEAAERSSEKGQTVKPAHV